MITVFKEVLNKFMHGKTDERPMLSKYDAKQKNGFDKCVFEVPKILNAYFKRTEPYHDEAIFLEELQKVIKEL